MNRSLLCVSIVYLASGLACVPGKISTIKYNQLVRPPSREMLFAFDPKSKVHCPESLLKIAMHDSSLTGDTLLFENYLESRDSNSCYIVFSIDGLSGVLVVYVAKLGGDVPECKFYL